MAMSPSIYEMGPTQNNHDWLPTESWFIAEMILAYKLTINSNEIIIKKEYNWVKNH